MATSEAQSRRTTRKSESTRLNDRRRAKEWHAANPDRARIWWLEHPDYTREYVKLNRDRINANEAARRRTPEGRARRICQVALRRVLIQLCQTKTSRTVSLNGYSSPDLRQHIESQFRDGMTWENWGRVWQLDHIREVAALIKEGVTDPHIINALTNLQPLLIAEHNKKTALFRCRSKDPNGVQVR